jgi:monoterpene epsilon-lactone hydrolase
VDTVALEEPGMFHVFPILMPWADSSRRVYRAVGEFVGAHLPGGGEDGGRAVSGMTP